VLQGFCCRAFSGTAILFFGHHLSEGKRWLRSVNASIDDRSSGKPDFIGGESMETRVAVMSIIVEDMTSAEKINAILHEYGEYIIGRMGIPYRARKISIISIALDAPQNVTAALAGKIGGLSGVSVKTAYSSVMG
jgi:putative iron-only hydrogenase system regulator